MLVMGASSCGTCVSFALAGVPGASSISTVVGSLHAPTPLEEAVSASRLRASAAARRFESGVDGN